MQSGLGNTLIIANPVAQNGNGAASALFAADALRSSRAVKHLDLMMTEGPLHGLQLAKRSAFFDTVLALGGDGLIHEVANGLMTISHDRRPKFGVLPTGSGNDYARTLGMDFSIENSIRQMSDVVPEKFDLGVCNGEYFVESLSFGLDAAIALDTVERRKRTGKTGTRLFLESGIDVLLHQMRTYDYSVSFDDEVEIRNQMLLFAVQIGRTYGGGFTICPDAKPDDGIFDLCIAHPPLGMLKGVTIFLLAKNAHHTGFKQLEFKNVKKLSIRFNGLQPPAQIDGEIIEAEAFEISCEHQVFEVLVPR